MLFVVLVVHYIRYMYFY